jgi:hypothetical protein
MNNAKSIYDERYMRRIDNAEDDANRLLWCIQSLRLKTSYGKIPRRSKEASALKRCSLDLTRALALLRKGGRE